MAYLRRHSFGLTILFSLIIIFLLSLIPCSPSQIAQAKTFRHTPIHYVKAHHISDDLNSFYTKIRINGTDLGVAVVDTGASDTIISIELANKANIDWKKGRTLGYVLADNSTNICHMVTAKINIEGIVRTAPVSVCPQGATLLGISFLSQTSMRYHKGVMTFR